MQILINIGITFVVFMSLFWAVLPGGFGLHNFNRVHNQPLVFLATITWWTLLASHLVPFYFLIFTESYECAYWWLLVPFMLQVLFFSVFGRNLSTR